MRFKKKKKKEETYEEMTYNSWLFERFEDITNNAGDDDDNGDF